MILVQRLTGLCLALMRQETWHPVGEWRVPYVTVMFDT